MPSPTRYSTGWQVNFEFPGGVRHRRRFPDSLHGSGPEAAQSYIDATLSSAHAPAGSALDQLVREYLNHKQKVQGAKPSTIYADNIRLKIVLGFCRSAGIKRIGRFDADAMRRFQVYYFSNGPFHAHNRRRAVYNPKATWEKYRSVLSAFFNWCIKRKLAQENPAADSEFKIKQQRQAPTIFRNEELAALWGYLEEADAAVPVPYVSVAFKWLAYTGCRPGEMWTARWRQVDFAAGVVRFTQTKTGKDRSVPLHPKLAAALKLLPRDTELVFDNGRGEPYYHESAYWKILRAALVALGIYHPGQIRNLYTFRHTFGASLARSGVNPFLIMEIMGHDRIETTMVYCSHFFDADRAAAVARLEY